MDIEKELVTLRRIIELFVDDISSSMWGMEDDFYEEEHGSYIFEQVNVVEENLRTIKYSAEKAIEHIKTYKAIEQFLPEEGE